MAEEAARQAESFSRQLDEVEEQFYLCFLTVNKARKLVMKGYTYTKLIS